MRFESKVALVKVAGQEIGRATALRLAQEGAGVIVADIDEQKACEVTEEIGALDREALAVRGDVTDAATQRFGRFNIVFADAGISTGAPVINMVTEVWDRVIAVNLRGVFLTCKSCIPALIASGGGAIVTMSSSMAGWDSSPGGAAYMASEEGVSGLARSLALQLRRTGYSCERRLPRRYQDAPQFHARHDRRGMGSLLRGVRAAHSVAPCRHAGGCRGGRGIPCLGRGAPRFRRAGVG